MAENRKKNPNKPSNDEAQSKRFIEDAKRLEVDETGALFQNAFDVVTSTTQGNSHPQSKDGA